MTKFLLGFFSFGWLRKLDFLPPLLLRLFLAPMLWVSGAKKLGLFSAEGTDFLNPMTWVDMNAYQATVDSLQAAPVPIPFPELMAWIIPGLEIVGAILLIIGFAVRWISIPLLLLVVGTLMMAFVGKDIAALIQSFFVSYGYADQNTGGVTQIIIYFIMFLTLFFMGAGRYFSIDWILHRKLQSRVNRIGEHKATLNNDPFAVNATTPNRNPNP